MGNYYRWALTRNGQVQESGTAWFPDTRSSVSLDSLTVDKRVFFNPAGANAVPVNAGGSTWDFNVRMLYFMFPGSDSTIQAYAATFLQTNMAGSVFMLGTQVQQGDKLILENGSGWVFYTVNTTNRLVCIRPFIGNQSVSYTTIWGFDDDTSRIGVCTLPLPSTYIQGNNFYYDYFVVRAPSSSYLEVNGMFYNIETMSRRMSASPITAADFFENAEPVDLNDPYPDIPNSEPSGPAEGVGIPASDPVDFPSLPSFSATDTGFITLFNPTLAQVKALADYMWNGLFDINNFKKILADPMDCILGFNMLPVAIPNSGPADVCIGNIISSVSMNVASSQWVEVDCGQLDLGLPYGSYLDFSPYTKYSIYLPYIGTCDLSADDVAGKVLRLKYHVDVLSCSCVAYLKCGDSVLYQWTGSCGYSIPVTQNDFSRMIMTIVSIAGAAIGGAVTGGAGAALARAGESAAKNVMGLKPAVHRSGSIGSSAGLMGGQTPYLILEVPKACKPKKQYHYLGYPSFTTVKLADVSGRQDFDSVILDGIPCTEEERDMIAAACEGGIYL